MLEVNYWDRNLIVSVAYLSLILIGVSIIIWKLPEIKKLIGRIRNIEDNKIDTIDVLINAEPLSLFPIIIINVEGKIHAINDLAVRMIGFHAEDLKGHGMNYLLIPEHAARFAHYKQTHATKGGRTSEEVQVKAKDDTILDLEVVVGKWTKGLDWYYFVFLRDIYHRKALEETNRRSREEQMIMRELHHEGEKAANTAFWKMTLPSGEIAPVSQNFKHLFGILDNKIEQEVLVKRIVEEDKVRVVENLSNAVKNKTGYDITYSMHTWNDYIITIESKAVAYKKPNGDLDYFIGASRLIKKEKKWM